MKLTDKIPVDGKTIRGQFAEPSNWDNMETLTWKQFIDNVVVNSTSFIFKDIVENVYKHKNDLLPSRQRTVFVFQLLDQKHTKRKVSEEVYNYYKQAINH
jgi:hypothetical protein